MSEFQVSPDGHGNWPFQPMYEITITSTIATTSPIFPRHHGRGAAEAAGAEAKSVAADISPVRRRWP